MLVDAPKKKKRGRPPKSITV
ncbi:hypothetical protein EON65_53125 [archaeon]|nr:MAG: hypothetical protein EON65_53125 [archaeon]